jgi:ElaB/YqjD/DUF883 family membrane-anchored ribosome-binding protein
MKLQIEDVTSQFEDISKEISNLVGSQVKGLQTQFEGIKEKISKNLEKLRLGVLQQAVDQVVEMSFADWIKNISESLNRQLSAIERVSKDGLVKTKIALNRQIKEIESLHDGGLANTTQLFNDLISKLRSTISSTVNSISGITDSTAKSGEDVKKIFDEISEKFSKAVNMAEEKLGGISENVFGSFKSLKETFSTKIIDTLNELLNNILDRLEISERATSEFWDQAKIGGGAALTMKDIWFIRSIEGARAHINDQISKAKMRVLIVAPELTDINIEYVKACKSHINIRIAAQIDLSDASHIAMAEELNKLTNVTYRNRKLKNLWGINKDYEEVVLCVLSESEFGTEIAGIGSIIQEHIKIFVPILEDAWMGAQKDVILPLRTTLTSPSFKKPLVEPKSEPAFQRTPIEPKPDVQEVSEVEFKPVVIPKEVLKSEEILKEIKSKVELEPIKETVLETPKIKIKESPPLEKAEKPSSGEGDPLTKEFDFLLNNLNNMSGNEVSINLEKIKAIITETRGYSGVLQPLNLAISTNKGSGALGSTEISQLESKITFWRRKLNV